MTRHSSGWLVIAFVLGGVTLLMAYRALEMLLADATRPIFSGLVR